MLKSPLNKRENSTPRDFSNPSSSQDLCLSRRENIDSIQEHTCTPGSDRQPKFP
jgi:hypothetical protein